MHLMDSLCTMDHSEKKKQNEKRKLGKCLDFLIHLTVWVIISALSGAVRSGILSLLDFTLWHAGTSHKLPVLFPVLSISECPLEIHYIRAHFYTTPTSLFSHGLCDTHLFGLVDAGHLINDKSMR